MNKYRCIKTAHAMVIRRVERLQNESNWFAGAYLIGDSDSVLVNQDFMEAYYPIPGMYFVIDESGKQWCCRSYLFERDFTLEIAS